MASLIPISPATYALVASEVATFWQLEAFNNYRLAEAFPIFQLITDVDENENVTIGLIPTSIWHFQVLAGVEPLGFAHARVFGPRDRDWRLEGVFRSGIAGNVIQAINLLDGQPDIDGEACLLFSPLLKLTALFIRTEDLNLSRFVVTNVFDTEVETLQILDLATFVSQLGRIDPSPGITFE